MLRFLLTRRWVRRMAPGLPVGGVLLTADLAMLAGRHVAKLDGAERRRLLALVRAARGRPSTLEQADREELRALMTALEPRLFVGSAIRRASPLPVPRWLL